MSHTIFRSPVALGALLTVPFAAPASAQVEEIFVQARKVTESLQEVPVAVSAYTGAFFRDAGLVEFSDIAALTPNFDVQVDAVQGNLFAGITIRGQTALNAQVNSDQAVGIVVNGAPITRGTNLFSNLFDVEQIEVLKGPQGTLFGKNTTGGTVIVRTNAPKLGEFSGYVEADIGNFERRDFEGVINIPLAETVALRLGAATQNRDGFGFGVTRTIADRTPVRTGDEFADDDELFFRGSLLFELNERFSMRINADYHEVDESVNISRVLNDGVITLPSGAMIPVALETTDPDFFASGQFRPDTETPFVDADEYNINATINYEFDFATLTSITSYRDQNSLSNIPYAPGATIINGQDSSIFAQETRLAGDTDLLKWQTGVFFSKEEGTDVDDIAGSGQVTDAKNRTLSIFGQVTYAITDRLNVTGGLRYTNENRKLGQSASNTEVIVPEVETSFDGLSWLISADYNVTDDVLVYASISRGFRSGAIDDETLDLVVTDANITVDDIIVEPEFVTNYEIGLKGDFLDNTLRWNSSLWYSDYSDIQVQVFDPEAVDENLVPIATLRNAASATLWGFETEIQYSPTADITLGTAIGYTNAEFDEFLDPQADGTVNDRSNEPIGEPDWQVSAFGRYDFEVSQDLTGGLQVNYRFRGRQDLIDPGELVIFADPSQGTLDSYSTVNAQLDFTYAPWNVDIALYARNITNNEYFSSGFTLVAVGLPLSQRVPGAPREWGVRLRKSF